MGEASAQFTGYPLPTLVLAIWSRLGESCWGGRRMKERVSTKVLAEVPPGAEAIREHKGKSPIS